MHGRADQGTTPEEAAAAEVLEVFTRRAVRRFLARGFDEAAWLDFVELTAADIVEEAIGPPVVPADPDG